MRSTRTPGQQSARIDGPVGHCEFQRTHVIAGFNYTFQRTDDTIKFGVNVYLSALRLPVTACCAALSLMAQNVVSLHRNACDAVGATTDMGGAEAELLGRD